MSADNWTQCPNCKQKREAIAARRQKAAVQDLYGKVSIDKFLEALNDPKNDGRALADELDGYAQSGDETMREDYEQAIDEEGTYFCNYSCYCNKCEFTWSNKIVVKDIVNEGKSRR